MDCRSEVLARHPHARLERGAGGSPAAYLWRVVNGGGWFARAISPWRETREQAWRAAFVRLAEKEKTR